MDRLIAEIASRGAAGEPFAIGTVIHTTGSTPQKAGARALFLPAGDLLGTLGGGCMEAEARRRGTALVQGGSPELLELHLDDDFGWDDGLICGGTAHILLQPRPEPEQLSVYGAATALYERRGAGVLALVGSGPPGTAGRACLIEDGAIRGDLGADPVTAAAAAAAQELLSAGGEEPRRVRLREPEATLYLEPILPKPVCFIAGAGHIGAALCHYAARCGFEVAILDDRASLCNRDRLPDAAHVLVGDIVETVREWPGSPSDYYVIVTRGHRHDAVVLRELIDRPCAYLGMIGSKRKILTIYDEFLAEGLATPERLARIHAPIGLDIGALTVEEIALCIAAEMVRVRRKGQGERHGRGLPEGGHGDCAGGRRVAENGQPEAALAARLADRAAAGHPLAESLPRRPDHRRSGSP